MGPDQSKICEIIQTPDLQQMAFPYVPKIVFISLQFEYNVEIGTHTLIDKRWICPWTANKHLSLSSNTDFLILSQSCSWSVHASFYGMFYFHKSFTIAWPFIVAKMHGIRFVFHKIGKKLT